MQLSFKSDRGRKELQKKYIHTVSFIYLCIYIYGRSLFYHVDLTYLLVSFHFTPLSTSCMSGILVTNSQILYFWEYLTLSSFLKDSFARYTILGWQSFFQQFEYVIPLPSGLYGFWWEVSQLILLRILYTWNHLVITNWIANDKKDSLYALNL